MDIIKEAKRVLSIEADALRAISERIDSSFEEAVKMIYNSKGRVVVTGMGKSGLVGKKIAATLASTGTPAFFLHPAEASHGDLGMVTKQDIIIAISNSGETEELLRLLPFIKRWGIGIISLSGNPDSTLSRFADVNIDISVSEEACPLGIVPTASTTAAIAMGDALAVALLIKRGFKHEDFASFHPGGSLGKKLLIKVKDLMHTGDSVPLVETSTPMIKAVVEMSSKRLGLTAVVDRDGVLRGILTDGDLRRGIERLGQKLFEMNVEDVMTKNPKTIDKEELAAKALAVMESHSITALIVPDGEGRVEGVIHLHDILKEGIV